MTQLINNIKLNKAYYLFYEHKKALLINTNRMLEKK